MPLPELIDRFGVFLHDHPRVFVLTGAGISTGSGIPDYRDDNGDWKRPPPIQFRDFVARPQVRQRYWARSLVGWPWFEKAKPNICHEALADWELMGRVTSVVTQNVDRLHQAAGSRQVIDLHGRVDRVICIDCGKEFPRVEIQRWLSTMNPGLHDLIAEPAPDGDAFLEGVDFDSFVVPNCSRCGGILKPDAVFFGETVPRRRVERAIGGLLEADGLLVIGSSLMVYSGFRFCRLADERKIPIVAITPGRTRADHLLQLKLPVRFEQVLAAMHATAQQSV